MSEYERVISRGQATVDANVDAGLRAYMQRVFGMMATAMLISAAVAYGISLNAELVASMFTGVSRWIVALAPLILILIFGPASRRMSVGATTAFFYVIAAAIGLSFSYIFLVFTNASIVTTFLATSVAFGGMALYGYTTKRDLSAWGRFLMMGLFGLIAAMILNWFMQSSGISFAISCIGVVIFAGFTAYDTQNIKNTYLQYRGQISEDELGKIAVYGALGLYLDFVNLFQFLLSFLGQQE